MKLSILIKKELEIIKIINVLLEKKIFKTIVAVLPALKENNKTLLLWSV